VAAGATGPVTSGGPDAGVRDPLAELHPAHLGAEAVERYLRRHGLAARKRLSQNHLVDGEVLEAIIEASGAGPDHRSWRWARASASSRPPCCGQAPGDGGRGRRAPVRAPGHPVAGVERLRLGEGDFLDLELDDLVAGGWDLVANLPYHVTSPVLHRVLGHEPRPRRLTLMLQREVAARIAAPPGAMSYLSVFVQYHARVRVVRVVPAAAFEPAPTVDSAVLTGETQPRRLAPEAEEDSLWRLVQAGFRERRKMLHNVLPRQLPQVGRARVEAALREVCIAPDRRPQTLSVEEWLALAAELGPLP